MDTYAMMESESRVSASIPIGAPGKQQGFLTVPYSRNESAWGSIQIPVTSIANGEGPTLLLLAGSHGDEYEGPIALMKLARALSPEMIQGRVIILPTMNHPAVCSATRLSPVDGLNMNRVFPGRRSGTATEMIAHYLYHHLVPLADVVVDLHSGGKTLEFVPSVIMHDLPDPDMRNKTLAAIRAFGAPVAAILVELDTEGMLDTVVERLGKIFVTTELGGAGMARASSVRVAERGVYGLLDHFGLLQAGRPEADAELPTSRVLHTPDANSYVIARDDGILEMLVDLGEEVRAGQPICQIHHFSEHDRPPTVYAGHLDGMLWSRHVPGLVQRGDCLAVIATDYPTA